MWVWAKVAGKIGSEPWMIVDFFYGSSLEWIDDKKPVDETPCIMREVGGKMEATLWIK